MLHPDHRPTVDLSKTYSRAELAQIAGQSEDVIAYWSRLGMLRHSEGGQGKGSHKRFGPAQVTIAAILSEVRKNFGSAGTTLSDLAVLLQRSVALFEESKIWVGNWTYVAELATDLSKFRAGDPVLVWLDKDEEPDEDGTSWNRRARSEADIISKLGRGLMDHDPLQAIVKAAEKFPPHNDLEADVAQTILSPLVMPGYQGSVSWLVNFRDGKCNLIEGSNDGADFQNFKPAEFGCGMFIPADSIVRKVWGIRSPEYYRVDSEGRFIARRLADHGIEAIVSPDLVEAFTFVADAGDTPWSKVEEVLEKIGWLGAVRNGR